MAFTGVGPAGWEAGRVGGRARDDVHHADGRVGLSADRHRGGLRNGLRVGARHPSTDEVAVSAASRAALYQRPA